MTDKLVEAVVKCREKFEHYVSLHMAKDPPDMDKAAANQEMVELCDAALASSSVPEQTADEAVLTITVRRDSTSIHTVAGKGLKPSFILQGALAALHHEYDSLAGCPVHAPQDRGASQEDGR